MANIVLLKIAEVYETKEEEGLARQFYGRILHEYEHAPLLADRARERLAALLGRDRRDGAP